MAHGFRHGARWVLALLLVHAFVTSCGSSDAPPAEGGIDSIDVVRPDGDTGASSHDVPLPHEIGDELVTPPDTTADVAEVIEPSEILPEAVHDTAPPKEPLTLTGITPPSGPLEGGTPVTLVGTGFEESCEVTVGGASLDAVFVIDSHYLNGATPAGAPGPTDVTMVCGDETATLHWGFTYQAELQVTSIAPPVGDVLGGVTVVVTGTGFAPDTRLFVGGKEALSVDVPSHDIITAILPQGTAGPADVLVTQLGATAVLLDGFEYLAPPVIDAVVPGAAPASGGTYAKLLGQALYPASAVIVGQTEATIVGGKPGGFVTVLLPAGVPGPSDVSVLTPYGSATLPKGLTYLPEEVPEGPQILNVVPKKVPTTGGVPVVVYVAGIAPEEPWALFLDDVEMEDATVSPDGTAITFTPPPVLAPGSVPMLLAVPFASDLEPYGLLYYTETGIVSVTPAAGPVQGGTEVLIETKGMSSEFEELRIGALPVESVTPVATSLLSAVTPPGSPGPADVVIVLGGGVVKTLEDAFTYIAPFKSFVQVSPDAGSVAGGTFVHLYGQGLQDAEAVTIGDGVVDEVTVVDATHLTIRTPPLILGTYDVTISGPSWSLTLEDAFTTYEPGKKKSGTWGGTIEESVDVTVKESGTGDPLGDATVVLGLPAGGELAQATDQDGHATFSGPDVWGPVQVTAYKEGYGAYSVVMYDAKHVTIYLNPEPPPAGTTYPGKTQKLSTVGGKVLNTTKYIPIPQGSCGPYIGDFDVLCLPCAVDDDCPAEGAACTELGDEGAYCTTTCLEDADCPTSFRCTAVGAQSPQCTPQAGTKRIHCYPAPASFWGIGTNQSPYTEVDAHDMYELITYPGDIAVICEAGYVETISGVFHPVVMGIRRPVFAPPDEVVTDQDVVLDIPLSGELSFTLVAPPEAPEGVRAPTFQVAIDLGTEGYIPMFELPTWTDGSTSGYLPHYPVALSGKLDGTSYVIYTTVATAAGYSSLPYSVHFVQGLESLDDDGVVMVTDGIPSVVPAGVTTDVHDLWIKGPGEVFTAGEGGDIYHGVGSYYFLQDSGVETTLRGIWGNDLGVIWAVGDDGTIVEFHGASFAPEASPVTDDLYAVHGVGDGLPFIAGDGVVLSPSGSSWIVYELPDGARMEAIRAFEDGTAVAAGQGKVYLFEGGIWSPLPPTPGFHVKGIIGESADDMLVCGINGRLYRFDGVSWTLDTILDAGTLHAITSYGDKVAVVGDGGALFVLEDGVWSDLGASIDYSADLLTVGIDDDGTLVAMGRHAIRIGPFVGFPEFSAPLAGEVSPGDAITWSVWDGSAPITYNYLYLIDSESFTFWRMMVAGDTSTVALPSILTDLPIPTMPPGEIRLGINLVAAPAFDIDAYSSSDTSIYDRDSWAVHFFTFIVE